MPRRPRSRDREESHPEGGRLVRQQHFKPGGNQGLWWALGAAAVVGLIVVLMISGRSGGTLEKEAATTALRAVFKAAFADDEKAGVKLVDARGLLAQSNLDEIKDWRNLTPERKADLGFQAFREVKLTIQHDLRITDMVRFESILRASTIGYSEMSKRVTIQWSVASEAWSAVLSDRTGEWLLVGFGRRN